MTDTATSEHPLPRSDKPASRDGNTPASAPSDAEGAAFSSTRKQAAGGQAEDADTERFTNTKLNIALINDPKNGPRFTLTKREAGLKEKKGDEKALEASDPGDDETDVEDERPATASKASKASKSAALPDDEKAGQPPHAPEKAVDGDKVPEAADERTAEAPEASQGQDAPAETTAVAETSKPAPTGVPPAAMPPDKLPIDSAKTFIGPNGTFYDESWRWMDWRGTRQSWNWSAALSLGHWFAYRRLYSLAGLHLVWLAALAAAVVNDIPLLGLIPLACLVVGLTGVYGNILYFRSFRRAVGHVTEKGEGSYQELQDQLAATGGTSVMALGVMGALSLAAIIGALGATYHIRGGFLLNFWPFF